jgi:hypothetical protein
MVADWIPMVDTTAESAAVQELITVINTEEGVVPWLDSGRHRRSRRASASRYRAQVYQKVTSRESKRI